MKISDRSIGYISIFALLLLFAIIAFGMWHAHHEEAKCIYVEFDELGTLQPEDDVVVRGYSVGSVGKITWLGDRARVQIKFTEPIIIREGTQFHDVNYALMGQRRLEIIPSKKGKILPDNYIHTGYFEPGIAEALRLIEGLNDQLLLVRNMVHTLTEGDSTHASIQQFFEEILQTVEGTLQNTEKMVGTMQPTINKIFAKVDTTGKTLMNITKQTDAAVETAVGEVNQKMALAQDALKKISESVTKANEAIEHIDGNQHIDQFLNTRDAVDKLSEFVVKINDLVHAINTKGLTIYDDKGNPVKLIPWKNMNIIGKTAREKAAERAEKGETLE